MISTVLGSHPSRTFPPAATRDENAHISKCIRLGRPRADCDGEVVGGAWEGQVGTESPVAMLLPTLHKMLQLIDFRLAV
jgi:hypothetical protein